MIHIIILYNCIVLLWYISYSLSLKVHHLYQSFCVEVFTVGTVGLFDIGGIVGFPVSFVGRFETVGVIGETVGTVVVGL